MLVWIGASVLAGIILAWLVAFAMDPTAFDKGAKR
jgi:hypothetical protein